MTSCSLEAGWNLEQVESRKFSGSFHLGCGFFEVRRVPCVIDDIGEVVLVGNLSDRYICHLTMLLIVAIRTSNWEAIAICPGHYTRNYRITIKVHTCYVV